VPDFGTRLTGRLGRWSVGILAADDRAAGDRAPSSSDQTGKDTYVGVARILRDFGRDSNVGLLLTERHFGAEANHLQSMDARIKLSPTWYFSGQAVHTEDRHVDSSSRLVDQSGSAFTADLSRSGRNLTLDTSYHDYGRGFRAPLGFIQRVDVRTGSAYAGYLFRPDGGALYDYGPSVTLSRTWDHSGVLQDKSTYVDYRMDFAGPLGFTVYRSDNYDRYLGQGLETHLTGGTFYVNSNRSFTFYGSYDRGTGINYTPAAGLQPFVGGSQDASFGFAWRPDSRARIEDVYYYTHLLGPRSGRGIAPTALVNHLERLKISYQFTKQLSLRGIFDYNFSSANPNLVDLGRYKSFVPDLLLTYLLNYGTAVYVGYNQATQNLARDPDTPGQLQRFGPPTYLSSRQVYVKLAYLKRF